MPSLPWMDESGFFSDFEAVRSDSRHRRDSCPSDEVVGGYRDAPRRRQAYKRADGRKVDGRRLLVDVERGRTVAKWRPRRLGGGLGATRRAGGPPRPAARPVSRPQQSYGARPSYGSGPPRRYRSRSRDRGYDRRR